MAEDRHEARIATTPLPGVLAVGLTSNRHFPRHSHAEFGIGVITAGAQRSWSGRGMVESLMGDVITVNAGEVHDGLPKSGAARSWRMLYVPAAALDAATEDDVTTRFEFQAPSARDDRMKALFEHADAARGASTDLAFEAALLRLLSAARQARPRARTLQSAPTAIGRARELMDDAPAHAWTLADLAAIAGLSRFQLLRSFACETGLTPHAYLVQRRVRLARDLIGGGAGLADAAMQAGFADQSHMTRAFLRQYGFTPGRFSALGRSH